MRGIRARAMVAEALAELVDEAEGELAYEKVGK